MKMLRTLREDALKSTQEREQFALSSFTERSAELDKKLRSVRIPIQSGDPASEESSSTPCESFRNAVTACYKEHGSGDVLACSSQVEAFTECAKQLCNVSQE